MNKFLDDLVCAKNRQNFCLKYEIKYDRILRIRTLSMKQCMFSSILIQSWISLQEKYLISVLPSSLIRFGNAEISWTTKMRKYACFIFRVYVSFDDWLEVWQEVHITGYSMKVDTIFQIQQNMRLTWPFNNDVIFRFLHRNLAFNFLICLTRNVFKLSMSSPGFGRYPPLRADKDWDLASENPIVSFLRAKRAMYVYIFEWTKFF